MKKIKQKVKRGWEVIKKVKTVRVRRTDKQIESDRVKKKKFADVCKIIDIIPDDRFLEVVALMMDMRLTGSELLNISYEKTVLLKLKNGKDPQDCFVIGELSMDTIDRINEDFLVLNPSKRKK